MAAAVAGAPRVVEVEERWLGLAAGLTLASYVGVVIRLGLIAFNGLQLQTAGTGYVFSSLYAEIVGCFIMGVIVPHRTALQIWRAFGRRGVRRSLTSTISLTTGLSGSVTTFSSWQSAAMQAAVDFSFLEPTSPAGQFVNWLSIQVIGLAASLAFLKAGTHLGDALTGFFPSSLPPPAGAPATQPSVRPSIRSSWVLVDSSQPPDDERQEDRKRPSADAGLATVAVTKPSYGTVERGRSPDPQRPPSAGATGLHRGTPPPRPDASAAANISEPDVASPAPPPSGLRSAGPDTRDVSANVTAAAEPVTVKVVKATAPAWAALTHYERWLVVGALLSTALLVIVAILVPDSRNFTIAMLLGGPGTLVRWRLAVYNTNAYGFPFGTFASNVVGSLIYAMATILLQGTGPASGPNVCAVLVGITNGFAGCLTTISTFALELETLPRKTTYVYWLASVGVSDALLLVMYGAFRWTYPDGQVPAQCS